MSRTALVMETGASLSYAELDARAEAWRAQVLAAKPHAGAMASLAFDTAPDTIAAYLGALRAGVPLLLLEPDHPGAAASGIETAWHPELRIARVGADLVLQTENTTGPPGPAPHPDLALLLSTSGSTGDPKLVRLSERNIASNASAIQSYLQLTHADRAATTLPFFYSYGLSVLNSYLAAGASLYLTQTPVTAPDFAPAAREAEVTSLALVPHQCEALLRAGFTGAAIPKLRYITQAGGKLSAASADALADGGRAHGWDLILMYGQTEAAPRMSFVPPEALPGAADTIGQAVPGGRLWIADADGAPISTPGVVGELVYEGPNVMMGYATRRADLAAGGELDALHTGDLAEWSDAGFARLVGRKSRFVKLFGLRINLDQVETQLQAAGHEAFAVAVEDRLVLLSPRREAITEITQLLAKQYGVPQQALHGRAIDAVPVLSSGKTDRRALEALARDALQQDDAATIDIAETIRQATRSSRVAPSDSFTALGGDSLAYLTVQLRLEKALGAAPQGWETTAIADLEDHIRREARSAAPAWTRIGSDVVLRFLAIALVVAQHATDYPLEGGTWVLLLLMGYSAARFQSAGLREGRVGSFLWNMLHPLVPLYVIAVSVYVMLEGPVSPAYFLFARNYAPLSEINVIGVYWFVGLYVQIVLCIAALGCLAPIRRRLKTDPWGLSWRLCAASLGLAFVVTLASPQTQADPFGVMLTLSTFPVLHVPSQGLIECLPIVFLGWAFFEARHPWQANIVLAMAGVYLVFFFQISPFASAVFFLGASILALRWRIDIPMPMWLGQSLGQLAAVSLFVYLTHMAVVYLLLNVLGLQAILPQILVAGLALIGAFGVGFALQSVLSVVERLLVRVQSGAGS
ncbi:MAG: AMP-binding protein [Pseudomonadota bacterium]